jgi:hypothetical protein
MRRPCSTSRSKKRGSSSTARPGSWRSCTADVALEPKPAAPRADRPMLGVLVDEEGTRMGWCWHGVTPEGGGPGRAEGRRPCIVEVNGVRLDDAGRAKALRCWRSLAPVRRATPVTVAYVRDGTELMTCSCRPRPRGQLHGPGHGGERPHAREPAFRLGMKSLEHLEDARGSGGPGWSHLKGLATCPPAWSARCLPACAWRTSGRSGRLFQVEDGVLVLAVPAKATGCKAGDVLLASTESRWRTP